MKLQKNKGGFTLIELIIAITILAILGTIAFISLQGYSGDARNSKRLSDVANLTTAMNVKRASGVPAMSIVDRGTAAVGTAGTSEMPDTKLSLAGNTVALADYGKTYGAGKPNYILLGIKKEEFSDPNGNDYLMGVTTTGGERYQFAYIVEKDGKNIAAVSGNYAPRDVTTTVKADADGTEVITIKDNFGFFKIGDKTDKGIVKKVSDSLTTATLDTVVTSGTDISVALAAKETDGLILSKTTNTPVKADTQDVPY